MEKFWELLRESVIVQALITLSLIITVCVLFITGRVVPDQLMEVTMLVIGFYFGGKVQALIHKAKG